MSWFAIRILKLLCIGSFLLHGVLYANSGATILQISAVQPNILKIRFDRWVDNSLVKNFQISSQEGFRDIYDIKAVLKEQTTQHLTLGSSVKVRVGQYSQTHARIVFELPSRQKGRLFFHGREARIVFDKMGVNIKVASTPSLVERTREDKGSKLSGARLFEGTSGVRQKRVVIDPGHGGKDCGATGVNGICEKGVVLNISKFLADELLARGYKVFMTRERDVFIELQDRTKFANDKGADIFISMHANALPQGRAMQIQGIETYFLASARSERAKEVAALENKDDIEAMNYFSKESFLNTINTHRIVASNRLAIDIQAGMLKMVRGRFNETKDGGVREGPFWVLAGALMPSVLIEVGYITHPTEGRRLAQTAYQKSLAKGIADGVDGYFIKNTR